MFAAFFRPLCRLVPGACFLMVFSAPQAHAEDCSAGKTPHELCGDFEATLSLKNDPSVQKARRTCEAFYLEALNSARLICMYRNEASGIAAQGSAAAAGVSSGGQSAAFTESNSLLTGAKGVYLKYKDASDAQRQRLGAALEKSRNDLAELSRYGSRILDTEIHCEKSGTPGVAPGALTIGLAKYSLEDQMEKSQALDRILQQFHFVMDHLLNDAQDQSNKLKALDQQLGGSDLQSGHAIEDKTGTHDLASAAVPKVPTADLATSLKLRPTDIINGLSGQALLLPLRGLARSTAGSAMGLASNNNIDGLTLMNVGVGTIVGALNPPAVVGIGTGLALNFIESNVRRLLLAKFAKIVIPYIRYLKSKSTGDSQSVAQGYQAQKQAADYCKKCNVYDMQIAKYCPAYNEYNPHWYDAHDHLGKAQQWNENSPSASQAQ